MKPTISVIVPVYNTEKYLEECIQSVLNQSFTDFELLLVDDGSTDQSGLICDKYAEQDSRIRVFHQKNGGVSKARKTGVENSMSEFICFVDADDMLLDDALKVMYENMSDDIDIVITWTALNKVITGRELVDLLLQQTISVAPWGKLYRKEIIVNSQAMDIGREFYLGDDYLANLKIATLVRYGICVPEWLYFYRDNSLSIVHTNKYTLEYVEKHMKEMERILGNQMCLHRESWYKFQLLMLRLLIMYHIPFSYKRPWIYALRRNTSYALSSSEKVVKYCRNAFLCRFILSVGHYMKKIITK